MDMDFNFSLTKETEFGLRNLKKGSEISKIMKSGELLINGVSVPIILLPCSCLSKEIKKMSTIHVSCYSLISPALGDSQRSEYLSLHLSFYGNAIVFYTRNENLKTIFNAILGW
jgi:hypothetical protein